MTTRSISAAVLAATFVMFSPPVLAEMASVTGTGMGTSKTQPMPVSDGIVVLNIDTMYESFKAENSDSPFSSIKGPCMGSALVMNGEIDGQGFCHYTDADGDIAVMKWVAQSVTAEGRTTGEWEVKGGSGKWANASGGGTFDAGTNTGSYTNNVTGEVTLN